MSIQENEANSTFLDAIYKYAEQQSAEIKNQIKLEEKQKLQQAEAEATKEAHRLMQKEIVATKKDLNRELSKKELELKKTILSRRVDIMNDVFNKAKVQLLNFTKSKEKYQIYINHCLENINKVLKGASAIIYIKPKDKQYQNFIEQFFSSKCKIRISDDISIGGLMAESSDLGLIIDETLDSKLESQKDWFVLNSHLTID